MSSGMRIEVTAKASRKIRAPLDLVFRFMLDVERVAVLAPRVAVTKVGADLYEYVMSPRSKLAGKFKPEWRIAR